MRSVIRFFKRLFGVAEVNLEHILADFRATIADLGKHVDLHVAKSSEHALAEVTARDAKEVALAAAAKADAIRIKLGNLIS